MQQILSPLFLLSLGCLSPFAHAGVEPERFHVVRLVDAHPRQQVTKTESVAVINIPYEQDKGHVDRSTQIKPIGVQKISSNIAKNVSPIRTYSSRVRRPANHVSPIRTYSSRVIRPESIPPRRKYIVAPFWSYRSRRHNPFSLPTSRGRVYIRRRQRPVSYVIRNGRRIFQRPFIQYQWKQTAPKTDTLISDMKTLSNRIRPKINLFGKKHDPMGIPIGGSTMRKPIKIGKPTTPSKDKTSAFNVPKIRGARKHFQKSSPNENVLSQSLAKKPSFRPDNIVRLNNFMGRRKKS